MNRLWRLQAADVSRRGAATTDGLVGAACLANDGHEVDGTAARGVKGHGQLALESSRLAQLLHVEQTSGQRLAQLQHFGLQHTVFNVVLVQPVYIAIGNETWLLLVEI